MRGFRKLSLTAIVVLAAAATVALKYQEYITSPWTWDGQVRANVIQVAPGVSGPIVKLPIRDNQFVKAGDLLFEIDPRTYQAALDQAKASYDVAQADLDKAQSRPIQAKSAQLQAEAELARAKADLGAPGEENAQLRAAKAALKTAELNMEFTRVTASVDGHVTNLNLRLGSQAVANQPALALVDINSYWVHGFFRETLVSRIQPGNQAVITLMSYPDSPLTGIVDSIGWGIAQQDGSTGQDLLPSINPTFEWIRLAQRVPVRVHLEEVPDAVALRVGTTASVLVRIGTGGTGQTATVPVPAALQAIA